MRPGASALRPAPRRPLALARALLAPLALVVPLATAALAGAFEDAAQAFERAMKGGDHRAQTDAVARLLETGDARAVDLVIDRALLAEDQFVYERALELLRERTDAAGKERVARAAQKHARLDVRVALVRLCGSLDTPAAVDAIVGALSDRDWMVQAAAIKAARERRAVETIPPLVALTALADGRVKRDAIDALRDLTGADYGGDGARWRAWWESAREGFTPKPPARRRDGGEEEARFSAGVDVGTAVREGFYEIRSKRTLFIVDLSASMEARTEKGSRLDVTKRELARAIESLGDDMLFNIVLFGDRAQLWKPRMVPASSANRSAAKRLVQGAKAEGMTATYDALKLAFSLADVDTIWLLSDGFPTKGAVTSEALIQSEVRKWNRGKGIAIHTIAFVAGTLQGENEDKERAKTFMRELAAENGGSCKVVE